MRSILLLFAIVLAPSLVSAGYPYYNDYYEPQFFVAHNIIPAVIPHQNFIEKDGKVQQVVKTEVFAPVYIQRTEVIDYRYPNYVRKDVFLNKVQNRGH